MRNVGRFSLPSSFLLFFMFFSLTHHPGSFLKNRYFSHSSNLSISSWTTEDQDALERCGHCDNCTRPPESTERKNVSVQTWQLCKIANYVHTVGGKATVNMLAGLAKGAGGGAFDAYVSGGRGKRKEKEKVNLDLDAIAGGVVDLSKDVSCPQNFQRSDIDHH